VARRRAAKEPAPTPPGRCRWAPARPRQDGTPALTRRTRFGQRVLPARAAAAHQPAAVAAPALLSISVAVAGAAPAEALVLLRLHPRLAGQLVAGAAGDAVVKPLLAAQVPRWVPEALPRPPRRVVPEALPRPQRSAVPEALPPLPRLALATSAVERRPLDERGVPRVAQGEHCLPPSALGPVRRGQERARSLAGVRGAQH
jgi:hypothetical protein